jgi:hypothetical protein
MFPTGTYTKANGDILVGPWENDWPTGIHTVTYADGSTALEHMKLETYETTSDGTSWTWVNI